MQAITSSKLGANDSTVGQLKTEPAKRGMANKEKLFYKLTVKVSEISEVSPF